MASDAAVRREGNVLLFSGVLDRAAVTTLWPELSGPVAGITVLDVGNVRRVDSAGVAMLAELAARVRATGSAPSLSGSPAGLEELRAAYRLAPPLDFNAPSAAS